MRKSQRCIICHLWFQPNPRTIRNQKACSRLPCQKQRKFLANQSWRIRHPRYNHSRRHKVQAWAKTYPDYWRHYRATHPDYVERDNRRRRLSRKKALCAAKQDAIDQIAVEKLRGIPTVGPESAAKQAAILRRLNGVVEFLFWKETAAKQGSIDFAASSA